MKYNILVSEKELQQKISDLKKGEQIEINICNRELAISKNKYNYTLWWGEHYGIDCDDELDIIDKIDMLTCFVTEPN